MPIANKLNRGYLREEPYAGKPHVRICEGEAEWLSYSTTPACDLKACFNRDSITCDGPASGIKVIGPPKRFIGAETLARPTVRAKSATLEHRKACGEGAKWCQQRAGCDKLDQS